MTTRPIHFVKMQGAGNDYVYIDCFAEPTPADPAALAPRIADRHFGVGGDGLILVMPSTVAAARMRMFNADASESEMCGNGVRCVAHLVVARGRAPAGPVTIRRMGLVGQSAVCSACAGKARLAATAMTARPNFRRSAQAVAVREPAVSTELREAGVVAFIACLLQRGDLAPHLRAPFIVCGWLRIHRDGRLAAQAVGSG
jgi:diaminopimelate epimerase